MRGSVRGQRRLGALLPRLVLWAAMLIALVSALVLVVRWSTAPRYSLWVNGEKLTEASEAVELEGALTRWADQAVNRPVILAHDGQHWSYRLGELGLGFPLEAGREQLARAIGERAWWQRGVEVRLALPASWEPAVLEAALAPVAEAMLRQPASASLQVSGDRVEVVPAVAGQALNLQMVQRALQALGEGERELIELPVTAVVPEVTTEAVEQMGIRRLVVEWSTEYDPSIPRAENVERAARAFDGLILKPGEILSYNATVGPVDESTGWRQAYVIVGGELVWGIGGGVCQVATTFYGAALRANMEILERHPHQLAVSYIPPSEDAAVAQGYQDLKIRNTTAGHLLVKTEAVGGRVTFRLYGDLPPGQDVRIESRVTGAVDFPTREIVDPALPPGQREQVRGGIPGLISEAYRLLYVDGELVRREVLSRDRYLPTAALFRSGPAVVPDTGGSE